MQLRLESIYSCHSKQCPDIHYPEDVRSRLSPRSVWSGRCPRLGRFSGEEAFVRYSLQANVKLTESGCLQDGVTDASVSKHRPSYSDRNNLATYIRQLPSLQSFLRPCVTALIVLHDHCVCLSVSRRQRSIPFDIELRDFVW